LLRAELIERGYDVVGAPDLQTALLARPVEMDRGPVRVIVIDQETLVEPQSRLLDLLLSRHQNPRLVLLAKAQLGTPSRPWDQNRGRPALSGEIASAVEQAASAADEQGQPASH